MALSAATLITLLSASTAFAATSNVYNSETVQVQQNHDKGYRGGFETILENLVSNSTITQDQETAVINALKPSGTHEGNKDFTSALDSLVSDGTISQDQETAIESALQDATPSAPNHDDGQMPSGNEQSNE